MKNIIRLTESELHAIINNTVQSLLQENVLGDDWRETEEDEEVMNNYEPFQSQMQHDELDDNWDDYDDERF